MDKELRELPKGKEGAKGWCGIEEMRWVFGKFERIVGILDLSLLEDCEEVFGVKTLMTLLLDLD